MKIGIDCRLWNETGVGRYIRNLVENLLQIDRRNEYVLFALSKDVKQIRFNIESSGKVQDKNLRFKIVETNIHWHTVKEQLRFSSTLCKYNLDLVHFPYFSVPVFYKRPFIVTIHDLILHHFPTGKASTLALSVYTIKLLGYKYIIQKATRNAKKIISVSESVKKEIIDHLKINPQKIVVTYEGVDQKIRNKTEIKNNQYGKYFLYVGNVYPHKNADRLIDAFNTLLHQKDFASISLVFVGKEDYFYKQLKEKVRILKLSDCVIFSDYVSDQELSSLYQNALAFITPSLMEGFGLPGIEAMSQNCLVLASNITTHKEIYKDCAVYFDSYSINKITEKMKEVILNDLHYYDDLVKKGSQRAKEFSWEKMAGETLSIYESCLCV